MLEPRALANDRMFVHAVLKRVLVRANDAWIEGVNSIQILSGEFQSAIWWFAGIKLVLVNKTAVEWCN